MVAGLALTSAGLLMMYLAVVDIDLRDAAQAFLNNTVIVRRGEPGKPVDDGNPDTESSKESTTVPKKK